MAMAEYVVFSVIRCLSELLLYEARHVPEMRGRIEVIQMKLRQLQSILEIADARQEVNDGIRSWIAETRETVYDVEDLLLVVLLSSRKESTTRRRRYTALFKEATNLHHNGPKIQLIEAKISALESDLRVRSIRPRPPRGIPNPSISRRSQQQKRTYNYSHFVADEDFIGLDDHVEQLASKLISEGPGRENIHQVVCITGMGGIGKTTIAKRIFHHDAVRGQFHAFAWACVSQQWQPEDVMQRILNKLEPEKREAINNMKSEELVGELVDVQKRKRCLIVLDDVWDMDAWDILFKPVFRGRRVNIKVLLTTRNKEIARCVNMDAPCFLYDQSLEMLKKKVSRSLSFAGTSVDTSARSSRYAEEHEYSSGFEDEDAESIAESFRSCFSDDEDELINRIYSSSIEDTIQDTYMLLQVKMEPFAALPEETVSNILSRTSPLDASRFAAISKGFKSAAEADYVWKKFLPSDWLEIVSRSRSPVVYASMKEIYFSLCHSPISLDGGRLSFSLEKTSGKKCYMIGARELVIAWADNMSYWKWTYDPHSRFEEVAKLEAVCWLDIRGKINVQTLSKNTIYRAYLVFKLAGRCNGMESAAAVVRFVSDEGDSSAEARAAVVYLQRGNAANQSRQHVAVGRSDGWKEVKLGSFSSGRGDGGDVEARLMETNCNLWKSGLIVQGIEFRPKP